MLGSLMMLASGCWVSAPSSASASPMRCSGFKLLREVGDDPARQRDVARLDGHAGRRRVSRDDWQEGVRRQQRGFVSVRVDDLRLSPWAPFDFHRF